MSLSVMTSLADWIAANGQPDRALHRHVDQHGLAFGPAKHAGEHLAAVELLGEHDPRLVALPVVIILEAGERPVDARRAHFEPVGMLDRIAPRRAAPTARRDSRAQSSRVSCRVSGRSAITCKVGSEVPPIILTRTSAEPLGLGRRLDQSGHFGKVRHTLSGQNQNPSAPAPSPGPASTSNDVEEGEAHIGAAGRTGQAGKSRIRRQDGGRRREIRLRRSRTCCGRCGVPRR